MNDISACGRCGRHDCGVEKHMDVFSITCPCGTMSCRFDLDGCIESWNAKAADYKRDADRERRMAKEERR